ncbi:hypothetical protein [Haloferula sargassicola]|uniref:Small CPxCG-related zinc finger protein n=1 Tax=Haloferula sargassicola TaxID=490096 RepID=A0ABP9UQY2_9BACT
MKPTLILSTAIVGTIVGSLSSCALAPGEQQQASACPGCKTVLEEVAGAPDPSYSNPQGTYPSRYYKRHTCPGCQGALTTLFKEGRLEHYCSNCQSQGTSCPAIHPVTDS